MSDYTPGSSSASSSRHSGVFGVPKICSCGEDHIVVRTSKTPLNPHRRFYGCAQAPDPSGKTHVFKWVDEAVDDELGIITRKLPTLEFEMKVAQKCMEEIIDNEGRIEYVLLKDITERLDAMEGRLDRLKKNMLMLFLFTGLMLCLVKAF